MNAVTAKLCGATGEKSMFVIAPNSFIWTGACEEGTQRRIVKNENQNKVALQLLTMIFRQHTIEETNLVVFPVQCVLCDFLSKFRIDLDFCRFK